MELKSEIVQQTYDQYYLAGCYSHPCTIEVMTEFKVDKKNFAV